MTARPLITLHAPISARAAQSAITAMEILLNEWGFPWWIDHQKYPDVVLMVESPPVWTQRSPTAEEWEHFDQLLTAGKIEEAHSFAQTGFPNGRRPKP